MRAALPRLSVPISLIRLVNGSAFKGLLMGFLVQAFPQTNAKEPDSIANVVGANRLVFGLECNHCALRLPERHRDAVVVFWRHFLGSLDPLHGRHRHAGEIGQSRYLPLTHSAAPPDDHCHKFQRQRCRDGRVVGRQLCNLFNSSFVVIDCLLSMTRA